MGKTQRSDVQPIIWDDCTPADNRKTVTTAGTAVALSATSTKDKRLTVQALSDNTNDVQVGASTVVAAEATQRGIRLPNYASYEYHGVNLSEIYIDSVSDGDGVTFAYET